MKPGKYKIIEEQYGKPIRQILIDVMDQQGSTKRAAKKLGVSQATFSTWLAIQGLKLKTIVVELEREGTIS